MELDQVLKKNSNNKNKNNYMCMVYRMGSNILTLQDKQTNLQVTVHIFGFIW